MASETQMGKVYEDPSNFLVEYIYFCALFNMKSVYFSTFTWV